MNVTLVSSELLLKESLFGLGVMFLAMTFNVYVFATIAMAYRNRLQKSSYLGKHLEVMRYAAYTMLLIIGMFLSLSIEWQTATLLTFSFFTSVGNFTVDLPFGWRLIPSLIAFSGLFSFAGATAIAIGMARQLMNHLDQHKAFD